MIIEIISCGGWYAYESYRREAKVYIGKRGTMKMHESRQIRIGGRQEKGRQLGDDVRLKRRMTVEVIELSSVLLGRQFLNLDL